MAVDRHDPLEALRRDPSSAGIFSDYDGTLAPIVDDPAAAVPLEGVPDLLDDLANRYRIVAVISGRPVSFLATHLPGSVVLVGLYGLEVQRGGERRLDPAVEVWRPKVAEAVERSAAEAPPGVLVEAKDISLTLHYRTDPALAQRVADLAGKVAAATGLTVRPARKSVELHPPVAKDKGTALRELAAPLRAACFLGDDVGDLQAFGALDELATRGVATVRIAVRSAEVPAELLRAADVAVDAPPGAAALLQTLITGPPAGSKSPRELV